MTPFTRAREMTEKELKAYGIARPLRPLIDSIVSMTIESCKEAMPNDREWIRLGITKYGVKGTSAWNAYRTATLSALEELLTNK